MSSSTTLTFIFPELTTLEVTIGNGAVPEYLDIAQNKEVSFEGSVALGMMNSSNIVGVMSRFDQSILNLLIDRHMSRDDDLCRAYMQHGSKFIEHEGVYMRVSHHR